MRVVNGKVRDEFPVPVDHSTGSSTPSMTNAPTCRSGWRAESAALVRDDDSPGLCLTVDEGPGGGEADLSQPHDRRSTAHRRLARAHGRRPPSGTGPVDGGRRRSLRVSTAGSWIPISGRIS
jgi:hypothetical protein